ncbi:MAG: DNA primase [Candidatus Jacksonbacteria bacterium RIFCSPLOWO2_12_FULL_44_15b]|nr:MAG: DNA primase [Candidatus Jacksonbacteria bacterium RIFCSPLOWO2_12_FULL_44_15b]
MTPAEQVKDRIDIVEFIGQYVVLKPAGTNFRGLCPFHKEKTPSFMVSPSRKSFKCFGCGKGGDIFTFFELREGMAFAESLRLLAEKTGVRLENFNTHLYTRKNRLYDLLNAASEFYRNQLLSSEIASSYILRRGIDEFTRDNFLIGYAPDAWHSGFNYLKQQKFTDEEMKSAGLIIQGKRGYYDRFRGRIMFPICDEHGRIIGFGGRILQDRENEAKYINSPETEIYSKSAVLYALHKAKDSIRKAGNAILVEGYMDAIASHMAGIANVVAVSGTALNETQLSLLKRFTTTIILAFDMDDAGIAAALRSYMISVKFGMNTKIVQLPKSKDPDELIQTDPKAWQKAIENSEHILEYYFSIILKKYQIRTLDGKKQARDALMPVIAAIPDAVEQSHFIERLSVLLGVQSVSLKSALTKITRQSFTPEQKIENKANAPAIFTVNEWLFRILALVIAYPKAIPKDMTLPSITLKDPTISALYKEFYDAYNKRAFPTVYLNKLQTEHAARFDELSLLASKDYPDIEPSEAEREFRRLLVALNEKALFTHRNSLIREIKRAEDSGDPNRTQWLLAELDAFLKRSST